MDQKKRFGLAKLIISIITCQLAGFIGSLFTIAAVPIWYITLNKPSFTPPGSLFGPVWTVLYLLMGIALFLIWRTPKETPQRRGALFVFVFQLILNTLWSILFFGMRSPLAGLADIVCLWAAILATIFLFSKISKPAALCLVPYLLWVSFASVLNASIVLLNR